ncbi:MAG: hypothetical protein LCH92_21635 [Proteobacteria bacterium]|nr:hypothetical protein [Pseudomonadota bacterium]
MGRIDTAVDEGFLLAFQCIHPDVDLSGLGRAASTRRLDGTVRRSWDDWFPFGLVFKSGMSVRRSRRNSVVWRPFFGGGHRLLR